MPIFAQMTESISTIHATPVLANLSLAAFNPVVTNLLIGLFLVVSIVMILLVLIQRPQGGGLSGAFGAGGGGGAGQTAFGTKTGDVLTWATIGIFVTFVGFAIVLNFATRPVDPTATPARMVAPAGTAPADDADAADDAQNPLDQLDEQGAEENAAGTPASDEQPKDDQ